MKKFDPKFIYLAIASVSSLAYTLAFTVNLVFQVTVVGLNPLQLVLVGTTLEVTALLFELPTGLVADVYSRRLSVIIGVVVVGLGLALQAIPTFVTMLLAQVVWGLGYTFTSGATDAWLVDEVGAEEAGNVFLRASSLGNVSALIGIGVSVWLSSFWLALPMLVSGAVFALLGLFLVVAMPEHNFRPNPREGRNNWQTMWHTFRTGTALIRRQPVVLSLIGVSLLHGLFSEGYDRLWTAYILHTFDGPALLGFTAVFWFGLTAAASRVLSIGMTETIQRRFDLNKPKVSARLLFVINAFLIVALLAFPLVPNFYLTLIIVVIIGACRSSQGPVHNNWLNQHIPDSGVRATVLSLDGQVNAFGQIAGGPALGVVGNSFSVRVALLISGSILTPVLWLLRQAEHHKPLALNSQPAILEGEA